MRKISLSLISLCCFTLAYSQHIHYQKTLRAALVESAKVHKPVLVIIQPSILRGHPDLASAIDSPEVARFFKTNFINYKYDNNDTAAISLLKTYPINVFPAYLFLDSNKNMLYKQFGATLLPLIYLNMGKKVLNIYTSGRTLTNYNARYSIGDRNINFLKDYISLREELSLTDNAKLIDEYVGLLPVISTQSYQQILFILKAGPIMYDKAYNFCFINKKIIDSIYKTETLALRQSLNGNIITNTLNQAIATKNPTLAQEAASYQQSKWQSGDIRGYLVSQHTMLNYYRDIKDTTLFYFQASRLYDNFYMTISADSAKKTKINKIDPLLEFAQNSRMDTTKFKIMVESKSDSKHPVSVPVNTKTIRIVTRNPPLPPPGDIAEELNKAAYEFYTTGTRNQAYLAKAMLWSKRSIELNPTYYSYDTLAHLLYRLGLFNEAQYTQNKAIALAGNVKATPEELGNLRSELNKMKNKQL